jgi:hypothetical protein
MTRLHRLLFAALAASLLAGCGQASPPSPIDGRWTVDIDATLANASSLGAGDKDLRDVRTTYEGGTLLIDGGKIVLGLRGQSDMLERKYTVLEAKGPCVRLSWDAEPRPQDYCVRNDRLEVRDGGTPLVVVYRRD